jgi:hypothetical protein
VPEPGRNAQGKKQTIRELICRSGADILKGDTNGGHPVLTKTEIITIILQEGEIKRLTERNEKLETACADLFKENVKLRAKIKKIEGRHDLDNVNI